jgi:glycerophosphoryl diester phosphodiesterase
MTTTDGTARTGRVFPGHGPAVVGHRGLGRGVVAGHPENTVGSMLAALDAGADWLEVDVQRTGDGSLVVRHDPTLPDGRFLVDVSRTDAEAAGITGVDALLDALPPGVPVDLDLKSVLEDATDPEPRRTAALLAPLLAAESTRRRLLVTSFDPAALLWLRQRVAAPAYGLITWLDFPLRHAVATAAGLSLDVVALHHGSFGPNRVERGPVHRSPAASVASAHHAGLEVLSWCPAPDAARAQVAAGVDALCLNDLPTALPAVRAAR